VPKVEAFIWLAYAEGRDGHGRCKLSHGLFPRFALPQDHASNVKTHYPHLILTRR